ncbi:MAG: patatin-like phospholipase family protein [Lysobacter sp.]|nr:patatin-like phospholipase family protein [Lysobacter sp.]
MSEPMSALADEAPLALCLSGGGLRATLFHLGVLQALRAARRGGRSALESVGEIYSVSGGSILAAHLVLNWEKYCGSEDEFRVVAQQIRRLAYRDIRNRVVRRWIASSLLIVPKLLGLDYRTYWLKEEYESLYNKACLEDMRGRSERPRPKLQILSTSFRTGDMCSFSAERFEISKAAQSGRPAESIGTAAGRIRVAFAVAASSAFPPLFPPLRLTERMLGSAEDSELQGVIDLSDGGVFDNLGAEKLIHDRVTNDSKAHTVVLSNAGASFKTEQKTSRWGVVARNVRASDIMMRRSADSTDHRVALAGMELVDIRIGQPVEGEYLSKHTQAKLKKIRTDLDRFPPMLADLLIAHGFGTGLRALRSRQFDVGDVRPETPEPSAERLDDEVEYAARRKALTLDPRDWMSYVLCLLALCLFTAIFWLFAASSLTETAVQEKGEVLTEKKVNDAAKDDRSNAQIERLMQENRQLKAALAATGKPVSERGFATSDYQIWIQFAGTLKREEMMEFGKRIQSQWPNAPGALRGGERTEAAAGSHEVRFGTEEDLGAANKLTADVLATGLVPRMKPPVPSPGIPPRSLEIWVSR